MKTTRYILAAILIAFTIWYIKQGIEQTKAKQVESFVDHSEIK